MKDLGELMDQTLERFGRIGAAAAIVPPLQQAVVGGSSSSMVADNVSGRDEMQRGAQTTQWFTDWMTNPSKHN